jgi:uncharacterized membrane protein YedE/YeeE
MATTTTFDRPFVTAIDRPSLNPRPAAVALLAIVAAALYLNTAVSGRQALLFLVGAAAGVVLYHAAFGFTASWRTFIVDRRGAGIRAQMLMLALTCLVFFPALGNGHAFGQAVRGSVSPVSVSVVAGAFLFGIGMQLGGGCASGTLYSAGGGNTRMLAVLGAFIAGSVIGTAHMPWWSALPATKPISLITWLGTFTALALSLAVFALITAMTIVLERRRHGPANSAPMDKDEDLARDRLSTGGSTSTGWRRVLHGPWPLIAGGVGLAAVNIATLAISGRPWGVTSAFALWGAKVLMAIGVNVAAWPYWSTPAQAASLKAGVIFDATSVMDIGIMLGALVAAACAGRFAPAWRVPLGSLAAAIAGGLLLGYGARIAYGCNIGAYFSGIASGSLHGWLWLPAAFAGNAVGTGLRPTFGLRRS